MPHVTFFKTESGYTWMNDIKKRGVVLKLQIEGWGQNIV